MLAVTGMLLAAGTAKGQATYYVDSAGGDDGAAGTYAAPFATITHALSQGDVTEVRVLAGTYDADSETFPLEPGYVLLVGYANKTDEATDPAGHIITGAGASPAATLFTYGADDAATLANLTLTGATGGAIHVTDADLDIKNCVLRDMTWATVSGVRIDGNSAAVVATNTLFEGNTGHTVHIMTGSGSFTAHHSIWRHNTNAAVRCANVAGVMMSFYDCLFEANHVTTDRAGSAIWSDRTTSVSVLADRCRFLNNTGTGIIGSAENFNNTKVYHIHNSLFADNTLTRSVFNGSRPNPICRNVSFVNNTTPDGLHRRQFNGVITIYNSIIADSSILNNTVQDHYRLYDTVIWNTPPGNGYYVTSQNVMEFATEFVDPDAGDYRLVPWNPAVDAGNNTHVEGTLDLSGNPRTLDGTGDKDAIVDLGAFESTFFHPRATAFLLEKPLYAMFAGSTIAVAVEIEPALTEPVDAELISTGPFQINPMTVAAGDSATLSIRALAGSYGATGIIYRAGLTETTTPAEGVASTLLALHVYDRLVTHGAPDRLFVKTTDVIDLPVSLINTNIHGGSPSELAIQVAVTGTGTHDIAWTGADTLAHGAVQTPGTLRIKGGDGSNTVTMTLSVKSGPPFVFAESGMTTAQFDVLAIGSPAYVSGNGGDVTGYGTQDNPFRSMTYTLAFLDDGDEIALLPGVYDATVEHYPITPGGVRIAGVGDAEEIVVDGQDEPCLFVFDTVVGGHLANITLTGANAGAIRINDSSVTLDGARFLNLASRLSTEPSGIRITGNSSAVLATRTLFDGNTGHTVWIMTGSGSFTAHQSVWRNNTNAAARITVNLAGVMMSFYDCLFEANHATTASAGAIMSDHTATLSVLVDRCRFINNTGTGIIGNTDEPHSGERIFHIHNSLFADNLLTQAIFNGRRSNPTCRNVTFVNNTTPNGLHRRQHSGVITIYNSIIADSSILNDTAQDTFRIYDTVIWNTPLGYGYHDTLHDNVRAFDPQFRNAANGDYRLRHVSAALDAGNNDSVAGEWDLDGNPRIVDHNRDKQAIVDLGAYELPTPRRGILMIAR